VGQWIPGKEAKITTQTRLDCNSNCPRWRNNRTQTNAIYFQRGSADSLSSWNGYNYLGFWGNYSLRNDFPFWLGANNWGSIHHDRPKESQRFQIMALWKAYTWHHRFIWARKRNCFPRHIWLSKINLGILADSEAGLEGKRRDQEEENPECWGELKENPWRYAC